MNDIAGLANSPCDHSLLVLNAYGSVLWTVFSNGSVAQSRFWLGSSAPLYSE
jgi:hypothetical protein